VGSNLDQCLNSNYGFRVSSDKKQVRSDQLRDTGYGFQVIGKRHKALAERRKHELFKGISLQAMENEKVCIQLIQTLAYDFRSYYGLYVP